MDRVWGACALALVFCAACDDGGGFCTASVEPALVVIITDSLTGEPRSDIAAAVAADGPYIDTLGPYGSDGVGRELSKAGAPERPGTYDLRVTAPGYLEWRQFGIAVTADRCHVRTVEVEAKLMQDPEPQIINGSFEINGRGSLYAWEVADPFVVSLVDEGAPEAGSWSVQCVANQAPTSAVAFQKILGLRNGDVVAVQAMLKGFGDDGGGSVAIVVGDSPWDEPSGEVRSSDLGWVSASLVDTMTLNAMDSVWVRLSAFPVEVPLPASGALFDSIVLTRVP